MGKVQSWDNPWDVYAMSTYNTITSLSQSPIDKNIIYRYSFQNIETFLNCKSL